MTNPSPGLSQPVRRVSHRPPLRERASPASPNSAASFPNCPNQCGESSPDRQAMRRASPAFPNCPNLCGELSIGLPHPVRRVPPDRHAGSELLRLSRTVQTYAASSPASPNSAASRPPTATQGTSSHSFPNQYGEFPELSKPMRRVVPRPPSNAASFSGFPELSNQCGELFPESHAVRRTVLRTKTAQHSPSVMRVSKYNGLRAHTHASTRRLCRPCLCFFYNFFINIILFYYWVTNRDFIDLFCHTPKT